MYNLHSTWMSYELQKVRHEELIRAARNEQVLRELHRTSAVQPDILSRLFGR